jgi:hypothetical protein
MEKKGRGGGCSAGAERWRRHRGEATEREKGDATPNLFLKHLDETLATIRLKVDETLETYI